MSSFLPVFLVTFVPYFVHFAQVMYINTGMSMFSKVYKFPLNVDAILELKDEIENTTPTHEFYMHNDPDRDDIIQDILMLKDLSCLETVQKLLSPIEVTEEHSVGFETVPANQQVKNHEDFLLGWESNPFVRKCNILFNLEQHPISITHGKASESKFINPGECLVLNVRMSHGSDMRQVNKESKMFSINLRKNYKDTIAYLDTIL